MFEEARRQFPTTDFVIDIMIDKHEITTSYHFIAMIFKLLFSANMKQQYTTYEYTIRGTAIRYIRRDSEGKIITAPIPRAEHILSTGGLIQTIRDRLTTDPVTPVHSESNLGSKTFPISFIGSWKRDEFDNIITISENGIQSSSSTNFANLISVSGDSYTFRFGNTNTFTIIIRLLDNHIVITDGTGIGQDNWNGIWMK